MAHHISHHTVQVLNALMWPVNWRGHEQLGTHRGERGSSISAKWHRFVTALYRTKGMGAEKRMGKLPKVIYVVVYIAIHVAIFQS